MDKRFDDGNGGSAELTLSGQPQDINNNNEEEEQKTTQNPAPVTNFQDTFSGHVIHMFGRPFRLHRLLGRGTFGVVYHGVDLTSNESFALKMEAKLIKHATLENERDILKQLQLVRGVPKIRGFATDGKARVLIMDLLGPSMQTLIQTCNGKFSFKTVHLLAIQLLQRLEAIHYQNIIHRDIKPSNIVIGALPGDETIYLIDFGLSKYFRHPQTLEHIPERADKNVVGTSRYASVRCHAGQELGRRDDLESLAYTLIYFLKGSLPWQGLTPVLPKVDQMERVRKMKMTLPIAELCDGIPHVFSKLLLYSRTLKMQECPDYGYLKQLFHQSMKTLGIVPDWTFDWAAALQTPIINIVDGGEF